MPQDIRYAGFGVRFVASLLDTFFLAFPLGVVVYFMSGGEWFDFAQYQQNIMMALNANPDALRHQPHTSLRWELLFEFLVLIVTILFWDKNRGATPGKKMLHIKIVDAKTLQNITNKQAITRSLGYIPSTLLFGIGFFMVIFRRKKEALHDLMANTVVIYDDEN